MNMSNQEVPQSLDGPRNILPEGVVAPAISIENWNVMFRAVTTRLTQAARGSPTPDSEARLCPVVVECLDALDKLHAALAQERQVRAAMH